MDMSDNLANSLIRQNVARQAMKAAGIPNLAIHKLIDNPDFQEKVAFNSNLTGEFIARQIQDFSLNCKQDWQGA